MSAHSIDSGNVLYLSANRGPSDARVEDGSDLSIATKAVAGAAAEVIAAGKRMDEMAAAHRVVLASQRRAMVMTGAVSLVIGLVITRGRK